MNVWALDHDPEQAGQWHSDQHVKACPFAYAQALAYAWHDLHNEQYAPLVDVVTPTPWFSWVILEGKPSLAAKSAFPGEDPKAYWTLFGQRVPSRRHGLPCAAEEWAAQQGGNYRWLWRLAFAVAREYRHRFGKRHPAEPAIWTLEALPFSLADDGEWQEPPLDIPHHLRRTADGYYDVVESNRHYYNTFQQNYAWTGREPPPWLKESHQLSIDGLPL